MVVSNFCMVAHRRVTNLYFYLFVQLYVSVKSRPHNPVGKLCWTRVGVAAVLSLKAQRFDEKIATAAEEEAAQMIKTTTTSSQPLLHPSSFLPSINSFQQLPPHWLLCTDWVIRWQICNLGFNKIQGVHEKGFLDIKVGNPSCQLGCTSAAVTAHAHQLAECSTKPFPWPHEPPCTNAPCNMTVYKVLTHYASKPM